MSHQSDAQSHVPVFQRMSELKLTLTPDGRQRLLADIDLWANYLREQQPAIKKQKAKDECKALKAASRKIRKLMLSDSGVDWANEIHSQMSSQSSTRLGRLAIALPPSDWKSELIGVLNHIDDVSSRKAAYVEKLSSAPGPKTGPEPSGREKFAQSLLERFIEAGGQAEHGSSGFPAFLRLVWEILPRDCQPRHVTQFSEPYSALAKLHLRNLALRKARPKGLLRR